jgi:hypothetical protein
MVSSSEVLGGTSPTIPPELVAMVTAPAQAPGKEKDTM